MGADCTGRTAHPDRQSPGRFWGRRRFYIRIVAAVTQFAALSRYDRPRNATTTTPAIASRPPHAVAMPGRSPVSTTDSSVATAGVK